MQFLLDTHVFLWAIQGSPRLGVSGRRLIEAADRIFVSSASIWEIVIKARLGKIEADIDECLGAIEQSGFTELAVRASHAAEVAKLPMHHSDPFDRLLIAQALVEPLRLLTADALLCSYGNLVSLLEPQRREDPASN